MAQNTIASPGSPVPVSVKKPETLSGLRRKEAIAGYTFLLPNLLGFLAFSVFPILAAIYLTFTDWDLGGVPAFNGLDNVWKMANDDLFWKAPVSYTHLTLPTT